MARPSFEGRASRHQEGRETTLKSILFDIWYLFRPPWDTGISPPELFEYIEARQPGAALDLGCGTGTNVITLAASGWRTTGVDFSRLAIHMARRRLRQAGLAAEFMVADVTKPLLLSNNYGLVLDLGCFHMLRDRRRYMKNLIRLLAPSGHWLVYAFLAEPDSPNSTGLTDRDLEEIRTWGMEVVERRDGMYGGRRSAWFRFERSTNPKSTDDQDPQAH